MPSECLLRPAALADLADVAEVLIATRAAAVPAMPALVHTDDEVRDFVGSWDLAERDVWVAESAERIVGFAGVRGAWLDDLYVAPEASGQGVGSALLEVIKTRQPDGFCLWVFASNRRARDFYRRHGLVELETTDGAASEEGAPDVRLAWPGEQPLVFFRGLIDAVDDELADLLGRRVALTHAVQAAKSSPGHSGRDASREREIAIRMAARAGLPVTTVRPIMDTVIEESLNHYESGR